MKKLIQEIIGWKGSLIEYLKYDYKLTFWIFINRSRRLFAFFKKHFGSIRRVSFILVAIVVGLLVNHYGGANFTQGTLSSFLVSAGAMVGGTIAIVFAISIFLLQNASDIYSSQYLEIYIHDWKEKLVYFIVIIITICLFGGGLFVAGLSLISQQVTSLIVIVSLIFIGIVFALIDLQYQNVRQKISPSETISFLEKEGINFLNKVQKDARKMADIINARDKSVSIDVAIATAYNSFLQPFVNNLDRQLGNLIEISIKLSDKQEIETTKRGFAAVFNILSRFFEARSTSSLAIPSGILFLSMSSDSQNFLSHNFERLNKAGEKFIKEGKDESAAYIIDVYNSLAIKAKDINFVGVSRENPILDNIIGYLNIFIESGQRSKNIEIIFQGSRVLSNIALITIQKGLETTLHGIQDDLLKMAYFGWAEKQTIIVDNCISGYLQIISGVFLQRNIITRYQTDTSLKNIALITSYGSFLIKSGHLPDGFITRISLSKGYDELYTRIVATINNYFQLADEREKSSYRSDIVELFKNIYSSLRWLSEQVKSGDSTLIDSIGRLIFNINDLIIQLIENVEFNDQRTELFRRLEWNIYLPYWFVHNAEKIDGGSNSFYTLTDSIAKTGIIIAEKLQDRKLVIDCIGSLGDITVQCLEKTSGVYGFDEPRVLEKASYLGILALKKGWQEVFTEVGLKIYNFESKYFTKYLTNLPDGIDPENHNVLGLPHKDQLFIELLRWRDDFNRQQLFGTTRMRDDAETMMYSLVEPVDIDRFMFEVWGKYPSSSDIEIEIKEKYAKRAVIKELIKLLNDKIIRT